MSTPPLVSVLLPCYDAERFLPEAMESLLGQTYQHLEIIAIDDGSTDSTAEIIQRYAARDPRVRFLPSPSNRGLIAQLNRGVHEARGDFIARLDADDIASVERVERQMRVLAARPEISLVGSGTRLIAAETGQLLRPHPVRCLEPAGARFMALFATPVVHPTVLARSSLMRAHPYGAGPNSEHTEDYELFARMLEAGANFANLDVPLITKRIHSAGVSASNEQTQIRNFLLCSLEHLRSATGFSPPPGVHRVLVNRLDQSVTPADLEEGMALLDELEAGAQGSEPSAVAEIRRVADMQRVDILIQASLKGGLGLRSAAARLAVRYRRLVRSRPARSYVASKVGRLQDQPILPDTIRPAAPDRAEGEAGCAS